MKVRNRFISNSSSSSFIVSTNNKDKAIELFKNIFTNEKIANDALSKFELYSGLEARRQIQKIHKMTYYSFEKEYFQKDKYYFISKVLSPLANDKFRNENYWVHNKNIDYNFLG